MISIFDTYKKIRLDCINSLRRLYLTSFKNYDEYTLYREWFDDQEKSIKNMGVLENFSFTRIYSLYIYII